MPQMASFAPLTNNQTTPPRAQDALGAPPAIELRSIATPGPKESRRKGRSGKVGSQKASKFVFNAAYWRATGVVGQGNNPEKPIAGAISSRILQRSRELLRRTLKIPKGELSHTEIRNKHDLQPVPRHLEKCFPMLGLAEVQWAATCFLREVRRKDKWKGSERSRAEAEEEREEREAVGSAQANSEGRIQDEEEVEAFGDEAELQGALAKASSVAIDGRLDRQTRSRIMPAAARS